MKPFKPRHTVKDVRVITGRGPWDTKSGGVLSVLFALSHGEVETFLDYDSEEFAEAQRLSGQDIRGLRSYSVRDIPKGSIGAREWHRARMECVIALSGSAQWHCIDTAGQERSIVLDGTNAVITPPGIMHIYTALEDNTRLQVICNTLFDPDDPQTHDTYSYESFEAMRTDRSAS